MLEEKRTNETSQRLSPRQRQIVECLARGLTVREISDYIGIGVATIETYIHRIKKKTGARSAAHCVAIALHRGEINFDELPIT